MIKEKLLARLFPDARPAPDLEDVRLRFQRRVQNTIAEMGQLYLCHPKNHVKRKELRK